MPNQTYQERKEQSQRYDNLAVFLHKTSWHMGDDGKRVYPYSFEEIRYRLGKSHVLTKDGEIRSPERMQKWAKDNGLYAHYTDKPDMWENIVEGQS